MRRSSWMVVPLVPLTVALFCCWPPISGASTYLIDPYGTGDFPDIASAVLAASSGDSILLEEGIYTGPGNRDIDFAGKLLHVGSLSGVPDDCILNCQHDGRTFHFHNMETSAACIEGLTIRSASDPEYGGAILIQGPRHNAEITATHCIFADGRESYAAHAEANSDVTLSTCDVYGNEGGDWVQCLEGQEQLRGNLSASPQFCDPASDDFHLATTSPCATRSGPLHGFIGAWPVGCDAPPRSEPAVIRALAAGDPAEIATARCRIFPQPITDRATIVFRLPPVGDRAAVALGIYDLQGRSVRHLDTPAQTGDELTVSWDRTDRFGRRVEAGAYFLRITAGGVPAATKTLLVWD